MAVTTKVDEVPIAEPVIIAVVNEASPPYVNNAGDKDDCSCGVPPNASRPVQAVSFCRNTQKALIFSRG